MIAKLSRSLDFVLDVVTLTVKKVFVLALITLLAAIGVLAIFATILDLLV